MLSDIDEDTACHRPTKKQRKTDDFTDEEEAGAVCFLPHHHEAGSREEADRPLRLPCMETGTASDRLMKKWRKTGDGRRIQELEEAVDKGLDGGQNRGDGLSNESRELLTLARKGDEKARKALQRLAKSWKSSAMVALDIWFREGSVEELEEMVNLGQDAAPSEGLSDVSRELLARARLGKKEACEALQRLATLGRSSAIAAQRLLFCDRLARLRGYPTLQEWANARCV